MNFICKDNDEFTKTILNGIKRMVSPTMHENFSNIPTKKTITILFKDNTILNIDIIKLIVDYGVHSIYNEELYMRNIYDKDMWIDIPIDIIEFDWNSLWDEGMDDHRIRAGFLITKSGKYHNMISLRSSILNVKPPGFTYLLGSGMMDNIIYLQCPSCNAWFGFSYIEKNNEYDGVVTIHFNSYEERWDKGYEGEIINTPFKLSII